MAEGGSYRVDNEGAEPVLQQRTKEHAGGNRPRDARGNEMRKQGVLQNETKSVEAKPAAKPAVEKAAPTAGDKE